MEGYEDVHMNEDEWNGGSDDGSLTDSKDLSHISANGTKHKHKRRSKNDN